MSARFPTTLSISLDELGRHGGGTAPHRDGWGIAYMQDRDAFVVREPEAAHDSRCLQFLRAQALESTTVIAHVRRATQGLRGLRNTQPFSRELGGRVHLFAHNGMLPGIERDPRFPLGGALPIGDTDSEHAFCALLERLAPLWRSGVPGLDDRLERIVAFAAELRELGPANFLYSDADTVFAHGDRRRSDAGAIEPPGLHVLCRHCAAGPDEQQHVALVASVPLSSEPWQPLAEGEVIALRDGRVVRRVHPGRSERPAA